MFAAIARIRSTGPMLPANKFLRAAARDVVSGRRFLLLSGI